MTDSLNWDHLRYFVAVIRQGTVIGAAKRLGVSHATVLRNISRLEQSLGIRLFDRIQSGYRPTTEGEAIYPNALAMEEQAETLIRRAMGERPAPEGLLTLATCDHSLFNLMPLLVEFLKAYPRIELRMEAPGDHPDHPITRLRTDVAIIASNAPPEDLVGRQLARTHFAYYASAGYLRSISTEIPEPDQCDWITWSINAANQGEANTRWEQNMLRHVASHPATVLHARGHDDALAAVRSGIGVGLLRDCFQDELTRLPFNVAVEPLGIWMLTHPDLRRSGRIQAFMDFVADYRLP